MDIFGVPHGLKGFELPLSQIQRQYPEKRPFCGRRIERSFLKISYDLSGVCLLVSSKPSKRRPFSFPDVKQGVSAQSITRPEHFRMLRLIFLLTRRTSQGTIRTKPRSSVSLKKPPFGCDRTVSRWSRLRITTCPSAGKKGVSAASPARAACCTARRTWTVSGRRTLCRR